MVLGPSSEQLLLALESPSESLVAQHRHRSQLARLDQLQEILQPLAPKLEARHVPQEQIQAMPLELTLDHAGLRNQIGLLE
jgi:hypothetical protein